MTFRLVRSVLLAAMYAASLFSAAAGTAPTQPRTRTILAVLDTTPSYRGGEAARERIRAVVRALGPGDIFLLLELGGRFSPESSVRVQCIMPRVTPDLLTAARNIPEFQQRKGRLDAVWAAAQAKQSAVLRALERPWHGRDVTPLYQLLDYVSHWLATAPPGERWLMLFSDLKHDAAGVKSGLPPSRPLAFAGVAASALFVPWEGDWSRREAAWAEWFRRSGAAGFSMLDGARSQAVSLLAPNGTPREPAKTW
jgi:hypothetical protein